MVSEIREALSRELEIGISNAVRKTVKSNRFSTSIKYSLRLTKKDMVIKILAYLYQDYAKGSDEWEVLSYSQGMVKKWSFRRFRVRYGK